LIKTVQHSGTGFSKLEDSWKKYYLHIVLVTRA